MSNVVKKNAVQDYLEKDLALYSLHMPGDISTSSIQFTDERIFRTYFFIVENNDAFLACVDYLVHAGAPVFTDARMQAAYATELEDQLRRGVAPTDAREAALYKVRPRGVNVPAVH